MGPISSLKKCDFPISPLEGVNVVSAPKGSIYIEFPWFTEKNMTGVHLYHVTQCLILIMFANRERNTANTNDFGLNSISDPTNLVRVGVLLSLQFQCMHESFGHYIFTTPTIYNHIAHFVFNGALSLENRV